ncbi:MAG: nitroreductase family protein [Methanomassiliicoccales archaeon]|nr:nitroreductase family protein [Methanomassiliicoccales archaeon]
MSAFTVEEQNQVLDRLIESRRSIRNFRSESPPRELIENVLQAGLLGPYARLTITREDFRHFAVIPRESEMTSRVASLIKRRSAAAHDELEAGMKQNEFLRRRGSPYLERLKATSDQGPAGLGKAPYYIVVAEQKGVPEVAELSIAHCLENMWLKATALGLAFQLLSITERMAEDREFCEIVGISFGEYALDGCLVGYPDSSPAPTKRPLLSDVTRWL